jgi:hypothetical protein
MELKKIVVSLGFSFAALGATQAFAEQGFVETGKDEIVNSENINDGSNTKYNQAILVNEIKSNRLELFEQELKTKKDRVLMLITMLSNAKPLKGYHAYLKANKMPNQSDYDLKIRDEFFNEDIANDYSKVNVFDDFYKKKIDENSAFNVYTPHQIAADLNMRLDKTYRNDNGRDYDWRLNKQHIEFDLNALALTHLNEADYDNTYSFSNRLSQDYAVEIRDYLNEYEFGEEMQIGKLVAEVEDEYLKNLIDSSVNHNSIEKSQVEMILEVTSY